MMKVMQFTKFTFLVLLVKVLDSNGQYMGQYSCSVPMENLALGKTASQSHHYVTDTNAEQALDGNLGTMQHTHETVRFPWWRVDLQYPTLVTQVNVYNRQPYMWLGKFEEHNARFHDVTIRVSNQDIDQFKLDAPFYPNDDSICLDNIGSDAVVPGGWNSFICRKPLVGRYLSIQITKDCNPARIDCNEKTDNPDRKKKNFLHMNLVQVMGCPPDKMIVQPDPVVATAAPQPTVAPWGGWHQQNGSYGGNNVYLPYPNGPGNVHTQHVVYESNPTVVNTHNVVHEPYPVVVHTHDVVQEPNPVVVHTHDVVYDRQPVVYHTHDVVEDTYPVMYHTHDVVQDPHPIVYHTHDVVQDSHPIVYHTHDVVEESHPVVYHTREVVDDTYPVMYQTHDVVYDNKKK